MKRYICVVLFTILPLAAVGQTVTSLETRPLSRPMGADAIPPQPPTGVQALALAMSARRDWPQAFAYAETAGPLAIDLIQWHRLRAGDGMFEEALAFLARRPHWPGLPLLRRAAEATIPRTARVVDVMDFFDDHAPQTLIGSLRLAQAQRALGAEPKALAEARRGWTRFPSSAEDEAEMHAHFGASLAADSAARLDAMLWIGAEDAAARLLDQVPADVAALSRARLALQRDGSDLTARLAAVPPHLKNDPGLAYDRFLWRRTKGRGAQAIELMLARSSSASALGRPDKWARQRIRLTRDLMWDQEWRRAYDLASRHHLTKGVDYAALEWLSGYIALTELNDPTRALTHFQRHGGAVATPISLSRSHYWQARAYRALGNETLALDSFRQGAKYQTAFYGLLSAEEAGVALDPALTGAEQFPADPGHLITRDSNYQIAQSLAAAGFPRIAIRFLTHLAETQDRDTIGVMTALAEARGRPNYELLLAKRALRYGHMLHRAYLPLHPMVAQTGDVPPELALSIARRESEFFDDARSAVGARGLMQLMPPTAQDMAEKIGVPFDPDRLWDANYNTTLGVAYLAELTQIFGNSPVQIAAAYNAGPSRPTRWMQVLGDPRNGDIDVVDWIERVPFAETRNYIMRVTETMPGYRARLTGQAGPVQFRALLNGTYVPPPPRFAPNVALRPALRPVLTRPALAAVPATE